MLNNTQSLFEAIGRIFHNGISVGGEIFSFVLITLVFSSIYIEIKKKGKMGKLNFLLVLVSYAFLILPNTLGFLGAYIYFDNYVALVFAIFHITLLAHPLVWCSEMKECLKTQLRLLK